MSNKSKLRRQIAWQAACLMYHRQESEYYRAKLKAARRVYRGWVRPADLPSNAEIREQVQTLARLYEGNTRTDALREMRLEALRVMRTMARFRPRLVGSALTGHIRKGSDIDLHVFSDSVEAITAALDRELAVYEVERKRVRKHDEERIFTHVHVKDRFPIEITVYSSDKAHQVFKCSITGKAMERASIAELEHLLAHDYPDLDLEQSMAEVEHRIDRFQLYATLLWPLEGVKQNPRYHPEGDALYHSLQVFDLARDELPYDEDFLLAALLHDVGKAIDPVNHVEAALDTLGDFITRRTAWLIGQHMEAQAFLDGTLGVRARRRLRQSENYEEVVLLARCDRDGRRIGVEVPDVEEALDYVRDLAATCGE